MRTTGRLKTWNERGFGFLTVAGSPDLFLHARDIQDNMAPQVGDVVSFEGVERERGLRAIAARVERGLRPGRGPGRVVAAVGVAAGEHTVGR